MKISFLAIALLVGCMAVPAKATEFGYFFGSSTTFKIDLEKNMVIESKPAMTSFPLDLPQTAFTIAGSIVGLIDVGNSYTFAMLKPDGTIMKELVSDITNKYTGFPRLFLQPKGSNLLLQYPNTEGSVKNVMVEVSTGKTTEIVLDYTVDKLVGFSSDGQKYYSLMTGECLAIKKVDVLTSNINSKTCLIDVDIQDSTDFRYFGNDKVLIVSTSQAKTTKARLYDAATAKLLTTVDLGLLDINDVFVDDSSIFINKAVVTALDPDEITVDFIPQRSIVKFDIVTGKQVAELLIENDNYLKFLGMNKLVKKLYLLVKSATAESYDIVIVDTNKFAVSGRIADVGSGNEMVFVQEP